VPRNALEPNEGERGSRTDPELVEDVVHVDLHRARSDEKLTANLCVGQALAQKVIDLTLARRE
jgi:hypothetical protein